MTDIIELAKKFARSITIIGGGYNDKVNAMEDNYRLMFHNDEIRAFADAIRQDQIEKDADDAYDTALIETDDEIVSQHIADRIRNQLTKSAG